MAYIRHLIKRDKMRGFSIVPSLREDYFGRLKTPRGIKADFLIFYDYPDLKGITLVRGVVGGRSYHNSFVARNSDFIFEKILVPYGHFVEEDTGKKIHRETALDRIIRMAEKNA